MTTSPGLTCTSGNPLTEEAAESIRALYDWHFSEWRLACRRLERAERKGHRHKFAVLKTAIRIHDHARRVFRDALDDLPF